LLLLLMLSLGREYYHYHQLKAKPTAIIKATVLNEYLKTTSKKSYKVIKLKSNNGALFYTTASKRFRSVKNSEVLLKIWTKNLDFLSYLKGFYVHSYFLKSTPLNSNKERLSTLLHSLHSNETIARIYDALFLAKPLSFELYNRFGALGISHLFAISGFHLGILSAVLFFLLYHLYKPLHTHYLPYRHIKRDIFFVVAAILLGYLLFLDSPPSLLRAYAMLLIGFILYDRGVKILSMQTLFIATTLLLALFPRLFFSLGFWLSVSGVYYIMLFFIHFKELKTWQQFLLVPLWVYMMMLPFSLYIFHTFSLYHPLSVIITELFTIFYPLSLFLHIVGFGSLLDPLLDGILHLDLHPYSITLPKWLFYGFVLLSLLASRYKKVLYLLVVIAVAILIYAIIS